MFQVEHVSVTLLQNTRDTRSVPGGTRLSHLASEHEGHSACSRWNMSQSPCFRTRGTLGVFQVEHVSVTLL